MISLHCWSETGHLQLNQLAEEGPLYKLAWACALLFRNSWIWLPQNWICRLRRLPPFVSSWWVPLPLHRRLAALRCCHLLAFQRRGVRLLVALGSGSSAALLVRFEDQVGGTKKTLPASCILCCKRYSFEGSRPPIDLLHLCGSEELYHCCNRSGRCGAGRCAGGAGSHESKAPSAGRCAAEGTKIAVLRSPSPASKFGLAFWQRVSKHPSTSRQRRSRWLMFFRWTSWVFQSILLPKL